MLSESADIEKASPRTTISSPTEQNNQGQKRKLNSPDTPKEDAQEVPQPKYCSTCFGVDHVDKRVTCVLCHKAYHKFCILDEPESDDYICLDCISDRDGFGFGEGTVQSLAEFEAKANKFKTDFFKGKANVTYEEIQDEYWRIVETANNKEPMSVEYGSDLDTETYGSGFPNRGVYARSGWNLCNFPKLGDSVLKHLRDISGINVPWFYVGMLFSSFCWHNEDHYAYSINFVHKGAAKQWYGIPGDAAVQFEHALRKFKPDLLRVQPDILFQIVTMMSPKRLTQYGVPVYAATQEPGQFIVTFPQAYHCGFNMGFNCAEAVNFAPADWLSYGARCTERYRVVHRKPVFPHDMLMVNLAKEPLLDVEASAWCYKGLVRMRDEHKYLRESLYMVGVRKSKLWLDNSAFPKELTAEILFGPVKKPGRKKRLVEESDASLSPFVTKKRYKAVLNRGVQTVTHVQCVICNHAMYISAVQCECLPLRLSCLRCYPQLCACSNDKKTLLFRYSIVEVDELIEGVLAAVNKSHEQRQKKYPLA